MQSSKATIEAARDVNPSATTLKPKLLLLLLLLLLLQLSPSELSVWLELQLEEFVINTIPVSLLSSGWWNFSRAFSYGSSDLFCFGPPSFLRPSDTNYMLYSTLLCKKERVRLRGVKDISPLSSGGGKTEQIWKLQWSLPALFPLSRSYFLVSAFLESGYWRLVCPHFYLIHYSRLPGQNASQCRSDCLGYEDKLGHVILGT